jgi:hypothetical protein
LKNVLAYYSAGVVVVNSEVAFKVQGPMLWSQFSAIFDNFRRKNWRFSQKQWFCFESKTPIFLKIGPRFESWLQSLSHFCKRWSSASRNKTWRKNVVWQQGDLIGRSFASWVTVYIGHLKNAEVHAWQNIWATLLQKKVIY